MPAIVGDPYFAACDEIWAGRDGIPWSARSPREYRRRFLVQTKTPDLSAVAVAQCPGIPLPFAFYQTGGGTEYDLGALLVDYRCNQRDEDDWQFWIVECLYSTEMPAGGMPDPAAQSTGGGAGGGGKSDGAANNPIEEPPDFEWDAEVTQVALYKDLEGKAFVNSAQDPFKPAPLFEVAYPVLIMTRNEAGFNRLKASQYAFAVNTDTFLGATPGTAQCLPPKSKQMFKGVWKYWRTTYRVRFSLMLPDGTLRKWQPEFLDKGFNVWMPGPKWAVPLIRRGAQKEVLLDGTGKEALANPVTGKIEPTFLPFKVYREMPFADLFEEGLA